MMQAFERLYMFGKPVLFNFGKNSKSKSKVGAIFTVAFLGFVIWVLYYFGKDIIQKKNPSVASSQSFQEDPAEIQFNTDHTFVFNFGILDKLTLTPFMNESIFTLQTSLIYSEMDDSGVVSNNEIPLDLEPCSKAYFGELADSFNFEVSLMYCLSKKQPSLQRKMSLLGKPESAKYQTLQILGLLCDSSTSAVPCGTDDEIKDALGMFQLQYSNTAVDPLNYEKPVTRFRDSYFTSLTSNSIKEVDLWIGPMEMKTDHGWLTESYKTENYVQPTKVAEYLYEKSDGEPFFFFYLQASGITTQYTRSYIKVQDIAARVNGIISFTLIVLIIIVTPFVRLKFYEKLIHDLFDVTMLRDSKGKMKMKRSKTKKRSLIKFNEQTEAQVLPKLKTLATKNGLLTTDEERSPKTPQEVEMKIIHDKQEVKETMFNFSENLISPRGESETKVEQQQQTLLKIQSIEKKPEVLLSVEDQFLPTLMPESPRGRNVLKKGTYGSPTLIGMKPDLTKPTFKTLMGDDGDTYDVFEDYLLEIAINQQEQEVVDEDEKDEKVDNQIHATSERADFVEEDGQTKRDGEILPDDPENLENPRNPGKPSFSLQRLEEENSDQINLTFWEYLRSFVSPNEVIKEKMEILNEGIRRINERLDIFNLLKKLRELDKLKILMLEDDQYILFEGLPKPEIMKETGTRTSRHSIKNAKFIQEKVKNDLVLASYQSLKSKKDENLIDKKLLTIFDEILVD